MAKRRLKPSTRGWTVIVVIVLLCAAAAAGLMFYIVKGDKPATLTQLPFYKSSKYLYDGESFMYFEGNTLVTTAHGDEESNRREISTQNVTLEGSPGISIIYSGNTVHVLETDAQFQMGGDVLSAKSGVTHIAALSKVSANHVIGIYNTAGENVNTLDFGQNYVTGFGFDNADTETFWVLETDVTASLPVSTLTTYDLGKNAVTGKINIQNQLVDEVIFTQNGIFVIGTNLLTRYDRVRNTESYSEQCYGRKLISYSVDGATPIFMFEQRDTAGMAAVTVYRVNDDEIANTYISRVMLPQDAVYACAFKGRPVIVTASTVLTYTNTGEHEASFIMDEPVDAAFKLGNGMLMVSRGDTVFQCDF